MSREVKLSRLETVLDEFEYPCDRAAAVSAGRDVTLVLADGTENLGEVLSDSSADSFASADEVRSELMSLLPQHAVGEPYQSEGDS